MQVKRQEGIDLFKALGYNATDAWTPDRLTSKLNALPKLIDDDKVKALKKKDKNLAVLLSKIVKAVNEAEGSITLSPEGKATMAKPKSTKKTKPDPEDEEDLDEEDEDGDEDEDEDEEDNDDDGVESESDDDGDDEEDSDDESEDEEEGDEDEEEDEEDSDDDPIGIEVGDSVDCGKLGECTVLKITGDNATVETGKGKKVKVPLADCVPLDPDSEEVEDDEEDTEDDEDDSSEDEEDDEDTDESEDEDDEEDTEDDEDEEMAEAVAKKPAKGKGKEAAKPAKGAKASSGKKASPFKGAGGEGKPGVIASIVEIMQTATKDKPFSKKDILAKLVKRFPDRTEEAMKQTLNIQLPTRLRAEKGMNIEKNENGYYVAAGKPKSKAIPEKPAAEDAPKKKKKK